VEVINRGKIVIDLVAGKVELPVPDYGAYQRGQAEAAKATEQHTKSQEAQRKSVEALNAQYRAQVTALNEVGRRAFNDAKGDDKWKAGLQAMTDARNQQAAAAETERRARQRAAQQALQDQRAIGESLDRMANGFMKVSRAAVLLGFTQDESLQKLVKNLALAQAGFDLFDGSRKIVQGLTEAMAQAARNGTSLVQVIGRGNIALAAMAAAAAAAAVAYQLLNAEREKQLKNAGDSASGVMAIRNFMRSMDNPEEKARRAQRDMDSSLNMASRGGPMIGVDLRRAVGAAEKLLEAEKEITADAQKRLNLQREAIEKGQAQLDLAKQRLNAERQLVRTVEASFSKLSEFEQKRLQSAAKRLREGGDINEYERGLFEKAGEGGIADVSRAREGRREGSQEFLNSVKGLEGATTGTTGSMNSLNEQVEKLEKSLSKITGGADTASALAAIEQQSKDITQSFDDFQKKLIALLKKANDKYTELAREQGELAGQLSRRG
jgi:hypothetical protein